MHVLTGVIRHANLLRSRDVPRCLFHGRKSENWEYFRQTQRTMTPVGELHLCGTVDDR